MSFFEKTRGGLALACVGFALVACASSPIVSSWRDPSAGPAKFEKVAAIALVPDEVTRREAEDEMVKQIHRAPAVQGYKLFEPKELENRDAVRTKLLANGFDGVVILRLVKAEKGYSTDPGTYPRDYYSFNSYYGMAYPMSSDPGYLRETTVVRLETNIYSLTDDKLVWACISETSNPGSVSRLVSNLAEAVAEKMEEEGLLPEK